jgi:hypothetical protein
MKVNHIIGICLVVLGIAMLFFGASMFTYRGNNLNPIASKAGMYSFIFWLPTIIIGIIFLLIRRGKR